MQNELFEELLLSVKEAGKILRKETEASRKFEFAEPDVKAIREKVGFSQTSFAVLIGVSLRTIQNWEQGHRQPSGAAKVLLRLVENDPEPVFRGLHLQKV